MTTVNDFNEIYRTHASAVYRLCLSSVSRPEVAEDITSEVFLLFHQQQHTIPEDQLPGWLFTVAKRRAADFWRHHYVEQRWSATQVDVEPEGNDPEFSLELLLERCRSLKQVHKICLVLRFRHDMSRSEIAAQTGLSELQVKGALQYALQLLRSYMDDRAANRPGRSSSTHPINQGIPNGLTGT